MYWNCGEKLPVNHYCKLKCYEINWFLSVQFTARRSLLSKCLYASAERFIFWRNVNLCTISFRLFIQNLRNNCRFVDKITSWLWGVVRSWRNHQITEGIVQYMHRLQMSFGSRQTSWNSVDCVVVPLLFSFARRSFRWRIQFWRALQCLSGSAILSLLVRPRMAFNVRGTIHANNSLRRRVGHIELKEANSQLT